jgi:Flp pilus assembly protein TadG
VRRLRRLRGLGGDEEGATLVEFAFVLPALCVVILAIFDLGYRSYATSVMQGALHEAARMATVGGVTPTQIDTRVRTRLSNFTNNGTVTISTQSYQAYSQVAQPEPFTIDNAPLNTANSGDCWKDYNPTGFRDLDRGAAGVGNADDVVLYTVTMVVPKMFPIDRFLGWAHTDTITQTTVLSNQPYAGRNLSVPTACMA